jgi:hypothetical protein
MKLLELTDPKQHLYQSHEEPERLYTIAGKYWGIMMTIEIFIFLAAATGGAYMLIVTFFDLGASKTQNTVVKGLNRPQLTKVIDNFRTREMLFEQLKYSTAVIADPSK